MVVDLNAGNREAVESGRSGMDGVARIGRRRFVSEFGSVFASEVVEVCFGGKAGFFDLHAFHRLVSTTREGGGREKKDVPRDGYERWCRRR